MGDFYSTVIGYKNWIYKLRRPKEIISTFMVNKVFCFYEPLEYPKATFSLSKHLQEKLRFYLFNVLFQVLHIFTKTYSEQALYILLCLGMNHQKSSRKSIRYRNKNFAYYSLKELEQFYWGWWNIHKQA